MTLKTGASGATDTASQTSVGVTGAEAEGGGEVGALLGVMGSLGRMEAIPTDTVLLVGL